MQRNTPRFQDAQRGPVVEKYDYLSTRKWEFYSLTSELSLQRKIDF